MSLVGWWKLNGNLTDDINDNNIVPDGPVNYVAGKFGNAIDYNTSGRMVATFNPINKYKFSLAYWGRGTGAPSSNYRNIFYLDTTTNIPYYYIDNRTTNTPYILHYVKDYNLNSWTTKDLQSNADYNKYLWGHFVLVVDGTKFRSYYNGMYLGETTVTQNLEQYANINKLILNNHGSNSYQVQDVRLFDHCLSHKEVKELAKAKVLHYKFDDFQEYTENLIPIETQWNTQSGWGSFWCNQTKTIVDENLLTSGCYIIKSVINETRDGGPAYRDVAVNTTTPNLPLRVSASVKSIGRRMRLWINSETSNTYSNFNNADGLWQTIEVDTLTDSTGSVRIHFVFESGSIGDEVYVTKPQLEFKRGHSTPFVNGIRKGIIKDTSGQGNNAVLDANTPTWVSDSKIGSGCYEFFNNVINCGKNPVLTKDQTIAMWLYPHDFSLRRNPYNKNYGGEGTITQETSGTLNYYYGTNGGNGKPYQGFNSNAELNLNQWNHVALVRDLTKNNQIKWYINGVKTAEINAQYLESAVSNDDLIIGDGYTSPYNGKIDDLQLYATALSDEDVKELYSQRASIDSIGNFYINKLQYKDNNLLDYSVWENGQTGSVTGFNCNGSVSENYRVFGLDPWNRNTVVWVARPDSISGADGGWNSDPINIDPTKLYRLSVWVNRTIGNGGTFYFGTRYNMLVKETGETDTNPYFIHSADIAAQQWELIVGHIWPVGSEIGPNHKDSGRYTISGKRIGDISRDFILPSGTAQIIHRSYLFYSTDISQRQIWCYPRVDVCDGTEPTINSLLGGFDRP